MPKVLITHHGANSPRNIENRQEVIFFDDQDLNNSAVLSLCGKYRYSLNREWDKSKPMVMFLMLNPSTADAIKDDATIRRCIAFAKSWGYGSLCVANLFAYRSTNPRELLKLTYPIGGRNVEHIRELASKAAIVVCAWGNAPILKSLLKRFNWAYAPIDGLENLHFIELAKDGTPKHPLYLKGDLTPKPFFIAIPEPKSEKTIKSYSITDCTQ